MPDYSFYLDQVDNFREQAHKGADANARKRVKAFDFSPKLFLQGASAFDWRWVTSSDKKKATLKYDNPSLINWVNKSDLRFIQNNRNNTMGNMFAKLKMLEIFCDDIINSLSFDTTNADRLKDLKKDFTDNHEDVLEYQKTFLNETQTVLQRCEELEGYINKMREMKGLPEGVTDETIQQLEIQLNSYYSHLVDLGKQESDLTGYPLQADEIFPHLAYRQPSHRAGGGIKGAVAQAIAVYSGNMPTDAEEILAEKVTSGMPYYDPDKGFTKHEEVHSVYEDNQMQQEQQYSKLAESIREKEDYNKTDYISQMLDDASGTTSYLDSEDEEGRQVYKFRDGEEIDEFSGLKGFNQWRKEGLLDNILSDTELLESLALTYHLKKEHEGEESARRWLQERIQHYASENMNGWDYTKNAVVGFVDDIVGDVAEIAGTAYGIGIGSPIEFFGDLINGENVGDAFANSLEASFDNALTRWGHDLSQTGAWSSDTQNKAINAFEGQGLNYNDNIVDPEKASSFFNYGGSGIGGFASDLARQGAHIYVSIYGGKGLTFLGGKSGVMLTKTLGGSLRAMAKGRKIGSTIGLGIAGLNEGAVDGIDTHDSIMKNVEPQLKAEYEKRAIDDYLKKAGVNKEDPVQLAKFLQSLNIGNYVDEQGNDTGETALLTEPDENGQVKARNSLAEMRSMLANSEAGKEAIEEYSNREDIKQEMDEIRASAERKAKIAGFGTFVFESWINGSIRTMSKGASANMVSKEKSWAKLFANVSVNKAGKVAVKNKTRKEVIKDKIGNAWNEAVEEGAQNITSTVMENVFSNSISRQIQGKYDFDSWTGAMTEIGNIISDGIGTDLDTTFSQETAQAALMGALSTSLGFLDVRKNRNGKWNIWSGSIFSHRKEMEEANAERLELQQALQQAIDKDGGLRTFENISSTAQDMKIYSDAIAKNKTTTAEQLVIKNLISNASLLHSIRDTEYGQYILKHYEEAASLLGEGIENDIQLSPQAIAARREQAKNLLTQKEGEDLTETQKIAITETMNMMKSKGQKVRDMEQIAENPTDDEVDALLEHIDSSKQLNKFIEDVAKEEKARHKSLRGLEYTAKNIFYTTSVQMQHQQKQQEEINKNLLQAAEQSNTIERNPLLSQEQKRNIALHGNSSHDFRTNSINETEQELKDTKGLLAQYKQDLKQAQRAYKTSPNGMEKKKSAVVVVTAQELIESTEREVKRLNKDLQKVSKTKMQEVEDQVITAYDILNLPSFERAFMLSDQRKNEGRYSEAQQDEIDKAKEILKQNGLEESITTSMVLERNIRINEDQIASVLENGTKYNSMVQQARTEFRNNVLQYRYRSKMYKDLTTEEVYSFIKQLKEDVNSGLITEKEMQYVIDTALNQEEKRRDAARLDGTDDTLNKGWSKYTQLESQEEDIVGALDRAGMYTDRDLSDDFFRFLKESHMTLQEFNMLEDYQKQELVSNSEILQTNGDLTVVQNYIKFAARTQDAYTELQNNISKVNRPSPSSAINNSQDDQAMAASEDEVLEDEYDDEDEDEDTNTQNSNPQSPKRRQILQNRSDVDGTKFYGSRINQMIDYLKKIADTPDTQFSDNPEIRKKQQAYKQYAIKAISNLQDIGMSDVQFSEVSELYDSVENLFMNDDYKTKWKETVSEFEKIKNKEDKKTSDMHKDKAIVESMRRSANSRTIETQKISEIQTQPAKRPILDFLESFNYKVVARRVSQNSQGKSGLGQQIYYVTDANTTRAYAENLGSEYKDVDNIPIFTCVDVGDDYTGRCIEIKVGDEVKKVAPIGVLNEGGVQHQKTSGINHVNSIRLLAVDQQNKMGDEPYLLRNNRNEVLTSYPLNWQNFIKAKDGDDYTGRRSILTAVKNAGEQVEQKVKFILDRLHIVKNQKNQDTIAYSNTNVKASQAETYIRPANMNELRADGVPLNKILGGLRQNLNQQINNPIIQMFYNDFIGLRKEDSIDKLFGNLEDLKHMSPAQRQALNDELNKRMHNHFYPGTYIDQSFRDWRFEIDVDTSIDGKVVFRMVPDTKVEADRNNKDNIITLLDMTNRYDDKGELHLSYSDLNKVLYNMMFNDDGQLRKRPSGATFCTVYISRNLVRHLNGDFSYDENADQYTDQQKQQKQENAQKVLSTIIRGGGAIVEGIVDQDVEQILIAKPNEARQNISMNNDRLSDKQANVKAALSATGGKITIETEEDAKRQYLNRESYISLKAWQAAKRKELEESNKVEDYIPESIAVTRAKSIFTGESDSSYFDEQRKLGNQNPTVSSNIGTNADALLRHHLWSTRGTDEEVSTLKRIPLTRNDTSDQFYTDEEIEQQFGFKAAEAKALVSRFEQFVARKQAEGWEFITDVVRPRQVVTFTANGKDYDFPISGEVDLMAVDRDGAIHLFDFKTVRVKDEYEQDKLRSNNEEAQRDVILDQWSNSAFGNTLQGYETQLNIYAMALRNMGFTVKTAGILAIPVTYRDAKVSTDDSNMDHLDIQETTDNSNRMYANSVLEQKNEDGSTTPFLDGLSLFDYKTNDDGSVADPTNIVTIPVDVKKNKLEFDPVNLMLLAQQDRQALANSSEEMAELLMQIARDQGIDQNTADTDTHKKTKKKIRVEVTAQSTPNTQPSEQDDQISFGDIDIEGIDISEYTGESSPVEQSQMSIPRMGATTATYANMQQLIEQSKQDDNYDNYISMTDSHGVEHEFSSEQMEQYMERHKQKHPDNTEQAWDQQTIDDLCNDLHCMFG